MLDPSGGRIGSTNLARSRRQSTCITLDAGIDIWGKRIEDSKRGHPFRGQGRHFPGPCANVEGVPSWTISCGESPSPIWGMFPLDIPMALPPNAELPRKIERVPSQRWAQQRRTQCWFQPEKVDLYAHHGLVLELTGENRLPSIVSLPPSYVDAGAPYGLYVDLAELLRRLADDRNQSSAGPNRDRQSPIYSSPPIFRVADPTEAARHSTSFVRRPLSARARRDRSNESCLNRAPRSPPLSAMVAKSPKNIRRPQISRKVDLLTPRLFDHPFQRQPRVRGSICQAEPKKHE